MHLLAMTDFVEKFPSHHRCLCPTSFRDTGKKISQDIHRVLHNTYILPLLVGLLVFKLVQKCETLGIAFLPPWHEPEPKFFKPTLVDGTKVAWDNVLICGSRMEDKSHV